MTFTLPKISKLVYQNNGNEIWQYFGIESSINDVQISSINPFIVESNDIKYVLTSDKTFQDDAFEYILLTSRRPSRSDFSSGRIKIKRWLKHPHFQNKTPKEIVSTWSDKFKFVKENEQENSEDKWKKFAR